MMGDNIILDL